MARGAPGRSRTPFAALLAGRSTGELRAYLSSFVLAAAIGVGGGFAAIGFQKLTDLSRVLLMGGTTDEGLLSAARRLVWWQALLLPAAGAAIGSLLLFVVFRRLSRAGTTDVVETVSLRKGGIHVPAVLVGSAATCAVIGAGGSIGREGPIVQLGAGIATLLGRATRRSPRDLALLVACGAAAGMAGAYNAPIGAAMFVMEVVLGTFLMEEFAPVVVASVVSALTVRAVVGTANVYVVPQLTVSSPWEAVPIFALGILAALVGWGFVRSLELFEDRLHRLPIPRAALPVACGLLVGAIGIAYPEVWGNGYDAVDLILKGSVAAGFAAVLLPAKAVATGLTAGSGIGGGVFTPTLFVGAALGGAFGAAIQTLFPASGTQPGLFALIGMGSVLAATTHAPLMAILMLFEMTLDAALIAPLMLGAITATLFARWIHADSIYTSRLRRRGIRIPAGAEEAALLRTYARDLVRSDAPVLPAHAPIREVLDVFLNSRRDALYVVGDGGRYVGVARIHDAKAVFTAGREDSPIIAMDVAVPVAALTEDESIAAALARFDDPELDEVAVVADAKDRRFVGTLSRRDILTMLRHEVLADSGRPVRAGRRTERAGFFELPRGWRIAHVPPPPDEVGAPIDLSAWQRRRGQVPLVLLRARPDGSREPLLASANPPRDDDVVVVLEAAPDPLP